MERQVDLVWWQLFDLGRGSLTPVTGLEYMRLGSGNSFLMLATTPTRLYQLQESLGEWEQATPTSGVQQVRD